MSADRPPRPQHTSRRFTAPLAVLAVAAAGVTAMYLGVGTSSAAAGQPARTVVPHIVAEAGHLSGHRYTPGRNTPVTLGIGVDGCDHDYGVPGVCIPARQPGNRPTTCAYLITSGFFSTPLLVNRDGLHLLANAEKRGLVRHHGRATLLTGCVSTTNPPRR